MENQQMDHIEIREHEIEYILGRSPGILLRIGTTVIFLVFLVILVGSSFFSYPDMITAKVVVTAENAPVPLVAISGGRVGQLFVADNDSVTRGTVVAVMENGANTEDMLRLQAGLEGTRGDTVTDEDLHLGDVQNAFTAWKYDRVAYQNFLRLQYHARTIRGLREQLAYTQEYIRYGERQNEYLEEELKLERKNYKADEFLAERKVIAGAELDKSRIGLLQKQYSAEANGAAMADSKVRMIQLQQSILDTELDYERQKKAFEDQIRHSCEILTGQMKQWEQTYVIRAPENGRVVYARYWVAGEFVSPGETMFTLLVEENGRFEGRIELPMARSGKVKEGQKVHIKLDNYPYMEYGILKGEVRRVVPVANKEVYRVEVALPQGLIGSYGRKLPLLPGMSGTAEIIAENQTILQRLFFPLKSLVTHYKKES